MRSTKLGVCLLGLCGAFSPAAQALARIEVSFDDPAALYASYYADIERVTVAAGDRWLGHFAAADTALDLSVKIGFAPIASANGRSTTSSFVGIGASGMSLYEQGAAHELMSGNDPNGAAADIEFMLGIDGYLQRELWFDPAPASRLAAVPGDRTDAFSVLLHEFGHAFGFNGWRDGASGLEPGGYASTFDELVDARQTPAGTALYFTGAQAVAAYGGPVPLAFGNYAHLGDVGPSYGADLMNGMEFRRGTRYDISLLDLLVLRDLGLPAIAAVPEPGTAMLLGAGLCALALRRRFRSAGGGDARQAG